MKKMYFFVFRMFVVVVLLMRFSLHLQKNKNKNTRKEINKEKMNKMEITTKQ